MYLFYEDNTKAKEDNVVVVVDKIIKPGKRKTNLCPKKEKQSFAPLLPTFLY